MSEPFVGEIKIFAGNFAPRGWAFCDGQLLAVSQNDALFSLLGTIYGGDGRTTFGLPDLRGRLALHAGSGPGLSPRQLGSTGGAESHSLSANEMPRHNHVLVANSETADQDAAANHVLADTGALDSYNSQTPNAALGSGTGNAGGGQSHTNLMPFQCVNYIIALVGIYPSRN